ncbi:ABC-type transport auxiliary lipoprotein family protein [Sphingomonas canadensis]|uniref:ABC-type transport auxiliary lipoprotein family protein n=1 Tax=Sphingomonas canadensis TaxID=1219257 RepID=A0ABW3H2K8_9SPHN|nr:ABC-type transport auxiliary lipoprotein family protein [Sphingomonas canadensis]MCW3835012.1 ABC-type transport auxiliary lipoprotein family protein [Sphingomonas canadensis]
MKHRAILAPLAFLPLAACVSFGGKAPTVPLLTLVPEAQLAVGETRSTGDAASITIAVPAFSQELATPRVPVRAGGTVAYLKDTQWVEPPARLFARLLSDTVSARTGRVVLSTRQSLMSPGARLTGELRRFGVEADTREAVVTYDASLMRGKDPVFEKRRFEARVPVAEIAPAAVGDALNQAANRVAGEVAAWIGS